MNALCISIRIDTVHAGAYTRIQHYLLGNGGEHRLLPVSDGALSCMYPERKQGSCTRHRAGVGIGNV